MAHFAKVEHGVVAQVIAINNSDLGDVDFPESESLGQSLIESLGLEGDWVQTSYNRNFRGQFAGVGMELSGDIFHRPQPYPSWTLSLDGEWEAPTALPDSANAYEWDEGALAWIEV